jgi:hypothetical protein
MPFPWIEMGFFLLLNHYRSAVKENTLMREGGLSLGGIKTAIATWPVISLD